jgi:phospholipid/cholesterol/gamma-HCH transport system substrate-binding protein
MRAFRSGMSPVRAGLIALVVILIGSWFAFSKDVPFTETYKIQAVFEDSNLVAPRSPVRIAGIDVGKVVAVDQYKDTGMSVVTMEITDNGRPVGKDATLKIRPRLFLEGNFFVDLKPGTPGAEELPDGGMVPVSQTAMPVQLDQILTTLQSDTRRGLQDTLVGLGEALDSEPTAADDADQDPDVQGLTGAQALNKALETSIPALRGSAIGAQSLQGTEKHDLSKMIKGIAGVSRGLARNENQLAQYITDFNTTLATTAAHASQLEEVVELIGPTSRNLRLGLTSVDAALPPTQAFAREILPGVRETPRAVAAAGPWLDQAIPFFSQQELGNLLKDITPATQNLARATHESIPLVRQSDDFNRCITDVILPTGNIKVDDGQFSVDEENYKEFWYAVAGQAGEGGTFDGDGPQLRLSAPGGALPLTTGKTNYQLEPLHFNGTSAPQRTSPAFPNKQPPLQRKVPCYKNPVPDVNGEGSVGPADGSRPNAAAPGIPTPGIGAQPAGASAARLMPLSSFAGGSQ